MNDAAVADRALTAAENLQAEVKSLVTERDVARNEMQKLTAAIEAKGKEFGIEWSGSAETMLNAVLAAKWQRTARTVVEFVDQASALKCIEAAKLTLKDHVLTVSIVHDAPSTGESAQIEGRRADGTKAAVFPKAEGGEPPAIIKDDFSRRQDVDIAHEPFPEFTDGGGAFVCDSCDPPKAQPVAKPEAECWVIKLVRSFGSETTYLGTNGSDCWVFEKHHSDCKTFGSESEARQYWKDTFKCAPGPEITFEQRPVAKPENGEHADTIVEIDGRRYRREAVARLPKRGERFFSLISGRVTAAFFDFDSTKYHILHELTDEPQPTHRVPTGEGGGVTWHTATNTVNVTPYSDDLPLAGDNAPPIERVEDAIRYLVTVRQRFGNTAIECSLSWGGSALNIRSRLQNELFQLKQQAEAWEKALIESGMPPNESAFATEWIDRLAENRRAIQAIQDHNILLDRGIGGSGKPVWVARASVNKEVVVGPWKRFVLDAILSLAQQLDAAEGEGK